MINTFITYIETVLLPLGAWGVFLATLVEQVIAPIPSAFVQLGAGFLLINSAGLSESILRIVLVVSIPSAIAVTIGSLIIYYLSYLVGKPLVDKYGFFLGVKWEDVQKLQDKFDGSKRDDVFLFILRSFPAIPTVAVDIFCGIVRYPIKTYVVLTLVGTFIRATVFGIIGWRVGSLYFSYAEYIASVEKYLLLLVIVAFISFVIIRTRRYNKKS